MSFLLDTNVVFEARKARGDTNEISEEWGRLSVPDPVPTVDGLLAATARVHGLTLVTRHIGDLARTRVRLLDPFAS